MTRIAACVLTCRRPEGLRRVLDTLARVQVRAGDEFDVVVVVNDPEGVADAKAACRDAGAQMAGEVRCVVEPRRGIPFARNRALDEVLESHDVLAFVDDDEAVEPDWIVTLLDALGAHGADAVTGPVLAQFESEPPAWATRGEYFSSRRLPSGSFVEYADTGNVLLRCDAVRETGLRFDERFALSGGSDTHFFLRFTASGRRIVWCEEAAISEWVPTSRVRRVWLLRRSLRIGTSTALIERFLHPGARTALVRGAKAIVRIAQGVVLTPVHAVLPGRSWFDAVRLMWLGVGMLNGLSGRHYREYARIHGA